MKSARVVLRKFLIIKNYDKVQQIRSFRTPRTAKVLSKVSPTIISERSSSEEFQQFSMKIKELMDEQQLEYFENVIRKVETIKHPVADLLRENLHNPLLDLIMNLITKMVNGAEPISKHQQSLAHAIQLIHIGNFVHQKGIFDLSKSPNYGNSLASDNDLILGNKIALLAGDFLLASAQMKITQMRHDEILSIISRAMCDVVDSNFVGNHANNDLQLPFKRGQIPKIVTASFEESWKPIKIEGTSGTAEDEWKMRQIFSRAFLIAKGCHATSILANQPKSVQKNCFNLGKNFYLTCQAFGELEAFKQENVSDKLEVNLLSAPALFHLSFEPKLYDTIVAQAESNKGIDHAVLYHKIVNGPGLERTENLVKKLKTKTEKHLDLFSDSDEKTKIETLLSQF